MHTTFRYSKNPDRRSLKAVALLLAVLFSSSQIVPAEASFAAPVSIQTVRGITEINIPDTLGRIDEIYEGKSRQRVVYIQDAHANVSAQKSIAAIIHYLKQENEFTLVGQEGAEGRVDTALLRAFPDRTATRRVMEGYLRRGTIGGPEFLAVTGEGGFDFYGVDKRKEYLRNLAQFHEVLDVRDRGLAFVRKVKTAIKNVKAVMYSKAQRELDELTAGYREGRIDLIIFISELRETAERAGEDLSRYRHLSRLLEVFLSEGETGQPMAAENLDAARLSLEIEALTLALKFKLADSPDAKKLIQLEEYVYLLEHGFSLELSRREAVRLEQLEKKFDPFAIQSFLEDASRAHHVTLSLGDGFFLPLAAHAGRIKAFYRHAQKRDRTLLRELRRYMHLKNVDQAVLVTGGFHRDGITKRLRRLGVSYAVIQPQISDVTPHEDYLRVMERTRSLLDLPERNTIGSPIPEATPGLRNPFLAEASRKIIAAGYREAQTLIPAGTDGPVSGPSWASASLDAAVKVFRSSDGAHLLASTPKSRRDAVTYWDRERRAGGQADLMKWLERTAVRLPAHSVPAGFGSEDNRAADFDLQELTWRVLNAQLKPGAPPKRLRGFPAAKNYDWYADGIKGGDVVSVYSRLLPRKTADNRARVVRVLRSRTQDGRVSILIDGRMVSFGVGAIEWVSSGEIILGDDGDLHFVSPEVVTPGGPPNETFSGPGDNTESATGSGMSTGDGADAREAEAANVQPIKLTFKMTHESLRTGSDTQGRRWHEVILEISRDDVMKSVARIFKLAELTDAASRLLKDNYVVGILLREEENSDVSRAAGLVYYERESSSDRKFIDFTGNPEIYAGYLEAIAWKNDGTPDSLAASLHQLTASSMDRDVMPVDADVKLDRGDKRLFTLTLTPREAVKSREDTPAPAPKFINTMEGVRIKVDHLISWVRNVKQWAEKQRLIVSNLSADRRKSLVSLDQDRTIDETLTRLAVALDMLTSQADKFERIVAYEYPTQHGVLAPIAVMRRWLAHISHIDGLNSVLFEPPFPVEEFMRLKSDEPHLSTEVLLGSSGQANILLSQEARGRFLSDAIVGIDVIRAADEPASSGKIYLDLETPDGAQVRHGFTGSPNDNFSSRYGPFGIDPSIKYNTRYLMAVGDELKIRSGGLYEFFVFYTQNEKGDPVLRVTTNEPLMIRKNMVDAGDAAGKTAEVSAGKIRLEGGADLLVSAWLPAAKKLDQMMKGVLHTVTDKWWSEHIANSNLDLERKLIRLRLVVEKLGSGSGHIMASNVSRFIEKLGRNEWDILNWSPDLPTVISLARANIFELIQAYEAVPPGVLPENLLPVEELKKLASAFIFITTAATEDKSRNEFASVHVRKQLGMQSSDGVGTFKVSPSEKVFNAVTVSFRVAYGRMQVSYKRNSPGPENPDLGIWATKGGDRSIDLLPTDEIHVRDEKGALLAKIRYTGFEDGRRKFMVISPQPVYMALDDGKEARKLAKSRRNLEEILGVSFETLVRHSGSAGPHVEQRLNEALRFFDENGDPIRSPLRKKANLIERLERDAVAKVDRRSFKDAFALAKLAFMLDMSNGHSLDVLVDISRKIPGGLDRFSRIMVEVWRRKPKAVDRLGLARLLFHSRLFAYHRLIPEILDIDNDPKLWRNPDAHVLLFNTLHDKLSSAGTSFEVIRRAYEEIFNGENEPADHEIDALYHDYIDRGGGLLGFGAVDAARQEIIQAVKDEMKQITGKSLMPISGFGVLVIESEAELVRLEREALKYDPVVREQVFGAVKHIVAGWEIEPEKKKDKIWLRLSTLFSRRGQRIYAGTDDREVFADIRGGADAALLGKQTEYLLSKVGNAFVLDRMQQNGAQFIDVMTEALSLAQLTRNLVSASA